MAAPSLLFIHRSVGQNLIDDAGIYKLVEAAGMPFILNDYNQNIDQLREGGGVPQHAGWSFPGGDTTPADYALLFSQKHLTANGPMLDIILAYDIIAIKSCFPNTRITSDAMLAAHQQSYERIINFFQDKPGKKLVILTSPPLIPILTLPPFARRARKLANWLALISAPISSYSTYSTDLPYPRANYRQIRSVGDTGGTFRSILTQTPKLRWTSHRNLLRSLPASPKLSAWVYNGYIL